MLSGVLKLAHKTREFFTPVLPIGAFQTDGVLTPSEFISAGDQLISNCPTWSWAGGDPKKRKSYLPENKQYLISRGVPSYRRVSDLNGGTMINQSVASWNGEDWCVPTLQASCFPRDIDGFDVVQKEEVGCDEDLNKNILTQTDINIAVISEYAEMEDMAMTLDAATASTGKALSGESANILLARRYDCTISYDKYYKTPRMWLEGHDENGTPLPAVRIFEDIMQDYAQKTVTVDSHPHEDSLCVSIHPCQHANAMLNIIKSLQDCGKSAPQPEQSLFIFLKFIQSICPTIEYDWSFAIQVSAGRD